MDKKIFIILPYKESLDPKKSGAVSIYVKDSKTNRTSFTNNSRICHFEVANHLSSVSICEGSACVLSRSRNPLRCGGPRSPVGGTP